ncbi:MAG: hypothetical protein COA92_00250 [Sulfurovum sp.]|nr:MAG: hypothetical protein COA92_00250 [Sulfurovum sp.]
MKIFIDTNIFLDVILNRKDAEEATQLLNSCHQKLFDGYLADITLLNIDYIASKQTKNIRDFLHIINQVFTVVGAENEVFDLAFGLDNSDLENSVQYVCASMADCSVIVSNDKKFYRGEIEVLSSIEFMERYLGFSS